MKKVLFFMFNDMTDYEITLTMHLLGADAGMEVITIGYEEEVRSRSGAVYKPHMSVGEALHLDVEGLIICGGWYGTILPELELLVDKLNGQGKLLAGICGAGTFILAKTGVLEDTNYTTPITEWTDRHREIFGEENPFNRERYINKPVVRDKNVITSIGQSFIEFGIEICDWFKLFETEKEKGDFMTYLKS